jgi:hypothetical protein
LLIRRKYINHFDDVFPIVDGDDRGDIGVTRNPIGAKESEIRIVDPPGERIE